MRHRARTVAVTLALAALAGCSTGTGGTGAATSAGDAASSASSAGSSSAGVPAPQTTGPTPTDDVTAPAPAPAATTSLPPLGPDLACMDPTRCYLQNPRQLTDDQLVAYLRTVKGAAQAPAADMRPWAFVVLGAGERKLAASTEPSSAGKPVADQVGIRDQRALFAYCRVAEGGGPVAAGTAPERTWYRVEPMVQGGPTTVWMNGRYLHPYGHDGAIPAC